MVKLLWKTILCRFAKLKIHTPYDIEIPHFGIQLRKTLKQSLRTQICAGMFMVDLLVTVIPWKFVKCPLTGEWIHKL